jgi:phosphotriesterase-related protein
MPDLPRVSVAGGSVASEQLGRTLLHEHLVVTSPEVWASWTALLGSRAALVDRAAAELAAIKSEHGIDTIVDVSTPDMGRNIEFIEEVSARSGVAVVVATGSWLRPPRSYLERDDEQLARYFVAEIEDGIEGGPSRAGVIKVASGRHLDDGATKIFRAAALAHQATGVPIIAHGEVGPRQHPLLADLLESLGVSPGSVCLAHVHDTNDYGYLADLAERGYWLGLDRFPGGFRGGASPAERIVQVERLAADGYAAQLCVSHDWCTRTTLMTDADERRYRDAYNPDGFSYCHRRLVPELACRGLAGLEERLFVDNPRRFLAPRTSRPARASAQAPPAAG